MSQEYYDNVKARYPMDRLEEQFERIERLGYRVATSNDGCQVWHMNDLIIDADFSNDFHENAASMIHSFWEWAGRPMGPSARTPGKG